MKSFIVGFLLLIVPCMHAMQKGGAAGKEGKEVSLKEEVRQVADTATLNLAKQLAQMVVRVEGDGKDHAHAQSELRGHPIFGPFIKLAYPTGQEQEHRRAALSDAEAALFRRICMLASCAVVEQGSKE